MKQKIAFVSGEADAYHRRNSAAHSNIALARFFSEYVQPSHAMLEIGCATAETVTWIAHERDAKASGVDPSEEAVAAGRAAHPDADLRVGTSDKLPFEDRAFDMVLFGFCLCWVDRELLFRSVAEADRVLRDGGFLGIWDFDPPHPMRRTYHHRPGLWSYKADYSALFLASPAYQLVKKWSFSHGGDSFAAEPGDRLGAWLLHKSALGYKTE